MTYSNAVRYAEEATTAARAAAADGERRRQSEARTAARERVYGAALDALDEPRLDELAGRRYCYEPALLLWRRAGRPRTGRHRRDLLHQLELDRERAALQPEKLPSLA